MDYLSDKMTVLVGEASSRVNDTRRRWREQKRTNGDNKRRQAGEELGVGQSLQQATSGSSSMGTNQEARQGGGGWPEGRGFGHTIDGHYQRPLAPSSLVAGGMPFGGDTFNLRQRAPPAIGFRTDLLEARGGAGQEAPTAITTSPAQHLADTTSADGASGSGANETPLNDGRRADSDESLYKGDAWARLWFQRVMILSLLRLLLFIRKVYEDFQATKVYNLTGQTGHLLIAAATLLLPTTVFTIYRVSRYLQVSLPPLRVQRQAQRPYPKPEGADGAAAAATRTAAAAAVTASKKRAAGDSSSQMDEEAQLTRALMSSPDQSTTSDVAPAASTAPIQDGEGLVTARQTPTNLEAEQFHDSRSQQEAGEPPKAPSRASRKAPPGSPTASGSPQPPAAPLESVRVEKLFADHAAAGERETTRVVTGASEQLLHGVLFIFWQLKRQVDVMGYLVERACLWRRPAAREKEELGRLRTGSDGLEWFQDFYAAFLAILAQVYTLGLYWAGSTTSGDAPLTKLSASQVASATSGLASADAASSGGGGGSSGAADISNSARALGQLLSSQAIGGKDVLIMSELIVSSAVVLSLLIAVRRHDDGPLTLGLSMLGWGSLFAARIIVIALSFLHLGWHLMLPLVAGHVLLMGAWIYSIALASHNDSAAERVDEARWDEETAIEVTDQLELAQVKTGEGGSLNAGGAPQEPEKAASGRDEQQQRQQQQQQRATSQWSWMEHLVLMAQILSLFALPSLFYWPIMFNLKLHFRPFKYLIVILLENFLLITAIWFSISRATAAAATTSQLYLLGFVGAASILGFLFIALYIACKPSLTEYFARADELFNEAEKSGIYYEFCSRVFKMPDLGKQTFRRLMNQTEVVEAVEEVVDE